MNRLDFEYLGDTYSAQVVKEDVIKLALNGKIKDIKVLDSNKFIYKLNKNSISARGKAQGLLDFFARRIENGFFGMSFVRTIYREAMEMKGV